MRRERCSACGEADLMIFLDLGRSPVADAYVDSPDEISPTYPLEVAVCRDCRLVQLLEVLPQDELFGTGYSFFTSASPPLSAYHEEYAREVRTAYMESRLHAPFIVEIGCNDGDFLRHFTGWRTLGVDPAGAPVKAARERGLDVLNELFSHKLAQFIASEHGHADVVVANHVLAHVENVYDVLAGVKTLLSAKGVAYVEVQYLPDLLVGNAFDLVYHEHRNFFSLSSLENVARRVGLTVTSARLTDRQAGSLRVTLRHSDDDDDFSGRKWRLERLRVAENWLRDDAAFAGVQGRVDRIRERLCDLLLSEMYACQRIIGYGAPAKATTLLNFCGIDRSLVECVVDTTPAKQGRFIPGTGIPITGPELMATQDEHTTVLILVWNYLGIIMRKHPEYRGRWLTPVPAPMII